MKEGVLRVGARSARTWRRQSWGPGTGNWGRWQGLRASGRIRKCGASEPAGWGSNLGPLPRAPGFSSSLTSTHLDSGSGARDAEAGWGGKKAGYSELKWFFFREHPECRERAT